MSMTGAGRPAPDVYEKVSGYAYNAGNTNVDTVLLNFNLVDTQTGTIRDSRSVFTGTMGAGQSDRFESDFKGECIREYRVGGTIVQ